MEVTRYLPLNNAAVIAALPQTSRLRGEIPAKAGSMARLVESVTLQSRGIASPFWSNLVALFGGLDAFALTSDADREVRRKPWHQIDKSKPIEEMPSEAP